MHAPPCAHVPHSRPLASARRCSRWVSTASRYPASFSRVSRRCAGTGLSSLPSRLDSGMGRCASSTSPTHCCVGATHCQTRQ